MAISWDPFLIVSGCPPRAEGWELPGVSSHKGLTPPWGLHPRVPVTSRPPRWGWGRRHLSAGRQERGVRHAVSKAVQLLLSEDPRLTAPPACDPMFTEPGSQASWKIARAPPQIKHGAALRPGRSAEEAPVEGTCVPLRSLRAVCGRPDGEAAERRW